MKSIKCKVVLHLETSN